MVHPLIGITVIGLGLLAYGKRDKNWSKKHKAANVSKEDAHSVLEFSTPHYLKAQELILTQPQIVAHALSGLESTQKEDDEAPETENEAKMVDSRKEGVSSERDRRKSRRVGRSGRSDPGFLGWT